MVQLVGSSSLGLGKLIDGKNQFVHIRYSANADGSNMTAEIQANTKYIGIMTSNSETPSTNPLDYSWGRFVGASGSSSYTWIRYSANEDGSNMTTIANEDTKYIGVAITDEDSAPTDNTRYSWALFRGRDGRGVEKTEVSYQKSTSGTVIPTGSWETTIPSLNDGEYLWTKTLFTYTDGTTTSTFSVSRNGTAGLGIANTDVHYQKSTSGTTAPTGTWTVTIPSVRANEYLWTRTTITYTDGSTSVSYSVGKMGADGRDAQLLYLTASSQIQAFDKDNQPKTTQAITISAKLQNASGAATFTAIPYIGNTAQPSITLGGEGNDRTLLPSQWTNPEWTIIAITATLGSLTDTISINKVKDGESGETPVVHIAWADSEDGSVGFSLELPTDRIPKYRGYYVDYSTVASTDPTLYKWERNPDDTGQLVDEAITVAGNAIANANEAKQLAASASQNAATAIQEASAAQNAANAAQGEVSRINGVITEVRGDINTARQEIASQANELQATKETLEIAYAKKTDVSDVEAALTTEISKKVGELQTTVSETYAAKNEVVDIEGRLQSQITQTATNVSSVVGRVDQLESDTTEAQNKVNEALAKSDSAQAAAAQARADAAEAETKITAAQADLNTAKEDLANTINRVDATEEDIAEAQAKVDAAQAAVVQAQRDADEATTAANNAQAAADRAQQDVAALTLRVSSAETAINQNSDQIELVATRTEEVGNELVNNYYTKAQTEAAIQVQADSITQTVSSTYATKTNTIKSSVEEFYQSTSPTALSGGSWSTTQPTWTQGKYIWRRTKNTYGNDSVSYTPSTNGVCITGNTGATGATGQNGNGISSTIISYGVSSSGTTAPSAWQTTIPTVSPSNYLWTKTVLNFTDGTSTTSYSVGKIGEQGPVGAKGDKGDTGATGPTGPTLYTWVKYANDASGNGMSDYPSGKRYIGLAYNKTTATESTNAGDYQWALIQGEQGIPGQKGDNGATLYTWMKYADNASGGGLSDSANGKKYIGIAYNKTTSTESTNPADYTWSLIQGPQGATGPAGQNGKGVSSYSITYQAGTSGTTAPTGTWSTSIPSVPQGQYLWTKMVITYTDNTSSTSYSVSYIPVNGQNGATGATGPAGNGVSSITAEFYLSTSKTTQTGGSWSTTQPTWSPGKYVWTRNKITYTNGSTAYTSPQCSSEWEAVNELQVGGRNLLRDTVNFGNSGRPSGSKDGWLDSWHSTIESEKYNGLTVRSLKNVTTVKDMCAYYFTGFNLGDTYTLSFWAKGTIDTFRCYFYGDSGYVGAKAINASIPYSGSTAFADGYCVFTNPQITNWTRISVTWKLADTGDINIAKRVLIRTDHATGGDLYVCGVKFEKGNTATDHSPAPEDMATAEQAQNAQDAANNAQSTADDANSRMTVAESTIRQLSDSISMLVTDENGSSLMTQTSTGWTFNMGAINDSIENAAHKIGDLTTSMNQANATINNLDNLANDLSAKTAYINMTTDDTGAPCIELGKVGNAFKVRITNTSVDFIEGSSKIAYVSNQALFIEKAIIKNELQIGDTFGFVWKTRSNGNLGLRYIDTRPMFSAIATYPQSNIDLYSTKDRYENFNISENPTGFALGSTIKIKIFNTTTNVYNYIECILISINSTTQIRIKATGVVTLY